MEEKNNDVRLLRYVAMYTRYARDIDTTCYFFKNWGALPTDLTQAAPLVENVRTRQLRFLCHVLKLPDDEPYKEYAPYIPPYGKRKPGRQRTLFLTFIQYLLGDIDNMIGPDKLSELAQDRCGWKKIVVACSAADRWWQNRGLKVSK